MADCVIAIKVNGERCIEVIKVTLEVLVKFLLELRILYAMEKLIGIFSEFLK